MSSETASPFNPRILVVGRLSGPKNRVILNYLEAAASAVSGEFPGASFQVLGGPVGEEHRALEARLPSVRFLGHQQALGDFYEQADLVVGSGRVALEAMARKKPVVAVGERLYLGPLTEENRPRVLQSNFGDCAAEEGFDWGRAAQDLLTLLKDPAKREQAARTGWSLLKTEYNMDVVYPQLENLYQDAVLDQNLASRHELPVLMYHRLAQRAPETSRFNLHVTAADFEDQLAWLKGWGFTPVTFGDLAQKRAPRKPVILTFDDGYEDNYQNLFPLLKKHGVRAVVYLLGDRSIRRNEWDIPKGEPEAALLNDAQVREMAQ
ncbi:MAG TPA: glycosyltransferase, partial [bacterium]|nr:glycosyltransferase [bacterium]